nr:formimidoylglutamase [Burkholderiales bacterium]
MPKYLMPNASCWTCRSDAVVGDYFCHNVIVYDLDKDILDKADFALLGFSCDVGVTRNLGRRGAKLAPSIIRSFLSWLTIPFCQTVYDCGDILVEDNDSLLFAQQMLSNYVSKIVHSGTTPIVLGGGHETAYGHYLGLLNATNADIAILNFDAHFDLRDLTVNNNEGTSGTPFRQIYYECQQRGRKFDYYCVGIQPLANVRALYEFAKETGTTFIEAHRVNAETVLELMQTIIAKHKYVYV